LNSGALDGGGSAASRAESLWLSVMLNEPSEAEPRLQSVSLVGKPEAFRTGCGIAAIYNKQNVNAQ